MADAAQRATCAVLSVSLRNSASRQRRLSSLLLSCNTLPDGSDEFEWIGSLAHRRQIGISAPILAEIANKGSIKSTTTTKTTIITHLFIHSLALLYP